MAIGSNSIRVSVLTPSWNRAGLLENVWEGLRAQSGNVSFEWIVGNDGSSDATSQMVAGLAERSDFPVTLIEASVRIGKSCIDNLLVEAAAGEFVIWCDSDDTLHPDALRQLVDSWDEIPVNERTEYMGVSARAETSEGVLGEAFEVSMDGRAWNEIHFKLGADLTIMARSDLLKACPFDEVDFLIPETSVWNTLGTRKARFIDRPLSTKNYKQPYAISFTGKMQYNRGRAYALGKNYRYVRERLGLKGEFVRAANFIRYCVHGDMGFSAAKSIWSGSGVSHLMLAVAAAPAIALVVRDRKRGVVEKTHIAFSAARKTVRIVRRGWGDSMH
jgi:glycosyltransferase involved in cell wall biosynthesis